MMQMAYHTTTGEMSYQDLSAFTGRMLNLNRLLKIRKLVSWSLETLKKLNYTRYKYKLSIKIQYKLGVLKLYILTLLTIKESRDKNSTKK